MTLLVSHPAFGYFCQDYGLEQIALEDEAKDSSPKEVVALLNKIKEKNINTIYVQKQHNYRLAKMAADNLNLRMVEINPYKENYFENLEYFGQQIGDHP